MKKLAALLIGSLLALPVCAEVWQAEYGVARVFNFKLYNADGTLDVDESDGGTEVSLSCNEGAQTTATNDFADEGDFYSISLTAAELQCERVAVVVAATTTEVFFVQTFGNTSGFNETLGWLTGDAFARLGAPAGASVSADIAAIEGQTDDIGAAGAGLTAADDAVIAVLGSPAGASMSADIAAIEGQTDDIGAAGAGLTAADDAVVALIGTPSDFGSGTSTVAANLQDLADNGTATFDRATDSLQAIRDRGDAAWVGSGSINLGQQETTVASVTSQTQLVPTATPTFVDQVNGWVVYIEDAGDSDAYHVAEVTDYNQATGVVTIGEAAPFTVAATDVMVFLPAFMDVNIAQSGDSFARLGAPAGASVSADIAAIEGQTDDIGAAGAGLTAADDAVITLLGTPAGANVSADIAAIEGQTDDIGAAGAGLTAADDAVITLIGVAGAGLTNIDLPNQTMNIVGNVTGNLSGSVGSVTGAVGSVTGNVGGNVTGSVGSVAGDVNGLGATAEADVRTAVLAAQGIITGTCDSGSTTTCVDNALTQADGTQLADRLTCYDDGWCGMNTSFTPGTDTILHTKVAPSTRASKVYTIFPSTAL